VGVIRVWEVARRRSRYRPSDAFWLRLLTSRTRFVRTLHFNIVEILLTQQFETVTVANGKMTHLIVKPESSGCEHRRTCGLDLISGNRCSNTVGPHDVAY
jgi:hypothetical protein